jgi:hypothetical protein
MVIEEEPTAHTWRCRVRQQSIDGRSEQPCAGDGNVDRVLGGASKSELERLKQRGVVGDICLRKFDTGHAILAHIIQRRPL